MIQRCSTVVENAAGVGRPPGSVYRHSDGLFVQGVDQTVAVFDLFVARDGEGAPFVEALGWLSPFRVLYLVADA